MSATTIEAASGAELHVHGGDLELHVNGEGLQLHLHGDSVRLHVHEDDRGETAPADSKPAGQPAAGQQAAPQPPPAQGGAAVEELPKDLPKVPTIIAASEGKKLDAAGNFTVKVPSELSGGAYFIFEAVLPPGTGVQLHRHVFQDEIIYLLEGEMEVQLGDKVYRARPGDIGNFTRGTPHGFHCVSDVPARAVLTVIPGGLERFFEQTRAMTDPVEIAKLAARYGMEFLGPNFIINSLGMRMVELLPGTFLMGSPDSDADARPDEKPQHRVVLTKRLMMGMHAVTVGQFKRFLDDTGYETEGERNGIGSFGLDLRTGKVEPKPQYTWRTWLAENPDRPSGFVQTDDHPIVCVSFEDAREFCRWLSDKEGRRYRLPTEAEWEHACRAGSTSRYYNGDAVEGLRKIANIADAALQEKWVWNAGEPPFPDGTHLPPYAQPWNDGYPFTAPVGRFEPNAFGLYDMAGNVGEWCSDWYDPGYYAEAPEKDPQGPDEGPPIDVSQVVPGTEPRPLRVIRGGVWLDPAHSFRSADRQTHLRHPVDSAADIGFRVVLEL
jgi:formylglycine-generating enzyme required for sulfatase activity